MSSPHQFQLEIPPGAFAGYIFDLDGTLIDSMPIHFRAWDRALREMGSPSPLSEELFYSFGGIPTRRVAELFLEHYKVAGDPLHLFERKEDHFVEMLEQVLVIEPVVEFARKVAKTHPVSVASGGPRNVVLRSLALAGLAELFPIVITPEDVEQGKPAPDMFLLAARRMGVSPSSCLVFEDADPGVQAAHAAGMQVVRIPKAPAPVLTRAP